jgi:hypothetical protein
MNTKYLFLVLVQMMLISACTDDESQTVEKEPVEEVPESVTVDYDFNASLHEWTADFADYPITDSVFFELKHGHEPLPAPLNQTQKGLMISGNNHSDNLFMFAKKKITGLHPNLEYEAAFEIAFASNAPSDWMGIGGAPGESVCLGIGVTTAEPLKVKDESNYYRMNIKKIEQAQDGEDMIIIGNVGTGKDTDEYTLLERTGSFTGKSDKNGELWVIAGTDSGFEGVTTLYYTHIKITFTPVVE